MSKSLFRLSRALSGGRVSPGGGSRERILAGLLRKRAAASTAGLRQEEEQLRNQILWALPLRKPPEDDAPALEAESA